MNFARMLLQESRTTLLKMNVASEFFVVDSCREACENGARCLSRSFLRDRIASRQEVKPREGERTMRFLPSLGGT